MVDIKYYSYNNDYGFNEHETEELAKSSADEYLSLRDEFSEDDEIEYGVMIPLGVLTETNRREEPADEAEAKHWADNGWSYSAHHEIITVTTLNHHLANEYVKLRAANMSLDAQLAEANRTIEALRVDTSRPVSVDGCDDCNCGKCGRCG
jgi:hypothetical protein